MQWNDGAAILLVLAVLFLLVPGDAAALNPQPEVPSRGQRIEPKALNPQPEVPSRNPSTNPKALNPQPEVPSKGEKIHPKALNPQPEVPSKPKKKKSGQKAKPPARQ